MTDNPTFEANSSLAIVDGVTLRLDVPGVTVYGSIVSLQSGGSTLDIGTNRFVLVRTGVSNESSRLVAFEGGQRKGLEVSLLLLFDIGGALMMLRV